MLKAFSWQPLFVMCHEWEDAECDYSRCLLLPVLDSIVRLPLLLLLLAAIVMLQGWNRRDDGRDKGQLEGAEVVLGGGALF